MSAGKESAVVRFCREWLDVLVVAISVAACFRAYFFEPFNIPTASMQPTLWGNYTVEGGKRGAWDYPVLSTLKWLWTGERFREYRAPVAGRVDARPRAGDGYADVFVGGAPAGFRLPVDAAQQLVGRQVKRGETVWRGSVVTGDFILVNRMKWNFRKPRDGDVMVFATAGLAESPEGQYPGADGKRYLVAQGVHFIKRMKATPGETYALEHPVPNRPDVVTMGEDEYFACGDNFDNSHDSRYFGPVPGANLRGAGSVVFWPFSRWRTIQ